LKTDFINNAIRWILEDLNIYDPYSGVTNNIVESMNSLIKRLTDWKEKPLDSIALSFYYLQNYYVNELLRGFCGLGNLTLKHRHRSAQMDRNHVVFPTNICHPDEIVELVKGELATAIQTDMNTDNTDEATTDATSEDIVTAESTSQRSLAIATVRQKRVYHVPEAGTFVVVGSKGDKYTVEMFPQEKCLCPSLGTCYHIIAVRMTLNLDNIDEKRVYNLTQLRKNSRKRPNKKAGKKQPRPCDEDQLSVINPAPDSAKKQYFFSSTPISTPQSILKKCKASPSIKPSAAKKIRFEHLPSLSDSEQHSLQTENFTTVNDFNFTALPSSPTPVTSSATPSRPTTPQSVPVSIPSVPSPSLPSSPSPVRLSPIHRGRLWQEFNGHELTFKEKTDIKFDKKLCCQTMNFCQSVIHTQFP
jgi:hypothetical protein